MSVIQKKLLLCNYYDITHNTSAVSFDTMNYTNISTMKMYSMGGGGSSKKSLKQNETEERELRHTWA